MTSVSDFLNIYRRRPEIPYTRYEKENVKMIVVQSTNGIKMSMWKKKIRAFV